MLDAGRVFEGANTATCRNARRPLNTSPKSSRVEKKPLLTFRVVKTLEAICEAALVDTGSSHNPNWKGSVPFCGVPGWGNTVLGKTPRMAP